MTLTPEREKILRNAAQYLTSPDGDTVRELLGEIDELRNSLNLYTETENKEISYLTSEMTRLQQSLNLAGNSCGIAATFLEFHGVPSKELNNCIQLMKAAEKRALSYEAKA